MNPRYFLLCLLLLLSSFSFAQTNILQQLLQENKADFQHLLDSLEKYEPQIIFTQINRDKNNHPSFESHSFNVQSNRYFYPASTVKMPIAFLALEKINQLNIRGLSKESMLQHEAVTPYNRLYEFLGQKSINEHLKKKGFDRTRIIHRLSAPEFDFQTNQYTNPVRFFGENELLYYQGEVQSSGMPDWNTEHEIRGKAYLNQEEKIIQEPFDFSKKNFVSLQNLHDILKTVLFPMSVSEEKRFNLTEEDYQFLYRAMSQFPKESDFPNYSDKADNYCKFFLFGTEKEDFEIPKHIRIFNKVGWAYGYLTDVSYIVDFENNIEFLVVATIHVNENQTYNDGVYEYESKGLPFFAQLGKLLYNHEKQRKKAFPPDLSK